jgi:hypothetical protein
MIMAFTFPRRVTVMDANPEKSGLLEIPDNQIHSDPTWAGKGTIVAVLGRTKGDTIALIDVSDPRRPTVNEVLWQKEDGPFVEPKLNSDRPRSRSRSSRAPTWHREARAQCWNRNSG